MTRLYRSLAASTAALVLTLTGATAAQAATSTPLPAYSRVSGWDRYETATLLAAWPLQPTTVILVSGDDARLADAVSAGPLAGALGGASILMLDPTGQKTAGMWAALTAPAVQRIVIVGGPASVPTAVETRLRATGRTVDRYAGADRYATSAAVAASPAFAHADGAIITPGQSRYLADAVTIGGAAGALHRPVLLADEGHTSTVDAWRAARPGTALAAVGGGIPQTLTDAWGATRLAGADRYATSRLVADWAVTTGVPVQHGVVLVPGTALPDALLGSVYGQVTLLVQPDGQITDDTLGWLADHGVDYVNLVGEVRVPA